MKNLFQRTISGIVYLVVIIGSLFLGKFTYGALFLVISLLALSEYYSITGFGDSGNVTVTGLLTGGATFVLLFLCASGMLNMAYCIILILVPLIFLIAGLYRNKPSNGIPVLFTGFMYVSLPFSIASFLAFPQNLPGAYTHRILLGLLILVWINDTGAYVTGMLFGRHKLFERISPKKSWEGFAGGTFLTLAASYFMPGLMGILKATDWVILGLIVCVFGVYGDLAESMLKRNAGKKDSGSLIPGHGGVLDRFDSMLFVVPAAVVYLFLS